MTSEAKSRLYRSEPSTQKLPHPIPYQGSKRALAQHILAHFPHDVATLIEPFAGSAAVSLAAARHSRARRYRISDANAPLMALWTLIRDEPDLLAQQYAELWNAQLGHEAEFYSLVRARFNTTHAPADLLYLLARCVKAAVRYNASGAFNQSADHRRKGSQPGAMQRQIMGASMLLVGRSQLLCEDYREALRSATIADLIYMDPPYQGVCGTRDPRYESGVTHEAFIDSLHELNERNISFIVSYDGRTGMKIFGEPLPASLGLVQLELHAGRSSQATLSGRDARTYESLYLSKALRNRA